MSNLIKNFSLTKAEILQLFDKQFQEVRNLHRNVFLSVNCFLLIIQDYCQQDKKT